MYWMSESTAQHGTVATAWSRGTESRFLSPSPSQSEKKKMDSSQSQSKIDSSHTALVKSRASEPSPSGNWGIYKLRYIYANVGETE